MHVDRKLKNVFIAYQKSGNYNKVEFIIHQLGITGNWFLITVDGNVFYALEVFDVSG